MTYQEAVEFLEDHDPRVLVLPDRSGFAVFRTKRLNVNCTLASGDAFESAVENTQQVLSQPHFESTGEVRS